MKKSAPLLIVVLMLSVAINGMFVAGMMDDKIVDVEMQEECDKYEGSTWWGSTRITDYRIGADWLALPNGGNITWGASADIEARYNSTSGELEWTGGNHSFSDNVTAPNLNILEWGIAYGWGNHALVGYLTSIPDSFDISGNITAGNVTATGNMTADNVFIPAYLRCGSRSTIAVAVGSQWYNITFNHSCPCLCEGFAHTYDDATNDTFTVNNSGIYRVTYFIACEDSAATPDAHVGFRLMNATAQTIIKGSYGEFDTSKQDEYVFKEHSFITSFNAGNQFKIQFTSDDTTITLVPHVTFNPGGPSCQISINKIANI